MPSLRTEHLATAYYCAIPVICGIWCSLAGVTPSYAGEPDLTFERDIRPILRKHCLDCHGATETLEGGLDLRLVRLMQKGGDSGAAIASGKPQESLLLQRVRDGEMPPGEAKLTPHEIASLEKWLAAGTPTARPEPESIGPGIPLLEEDRQWWSFRPLEKPAVPEFADASRVRTPVDSFLLAAMPDGLHYSPDAPLRTQALRVYFDLTGLPPTPEQLDRFLNDKRENAYELLVEELLASPHYGERWGRHWMDIAGYADSEGKTTQDAVRNSAFRYRDYVIRAFNSNKPFDRFLHEQLAGDELAGPANGDWTPEQIDLLAATGFLRMAGDGTGSGDNSPEARNLVIAETMQIVSTSLLGLTVACAQCHDHRYDPISHTDYFAMRAVFDPALDWQQWKVPAQRDVSLYTQADREAAAKIEEEAQAVLKERAEKQAVFIEEAVKKELEKFEEPLREQLNAAFHTPADKRTAEQKDVLKKNPSINITPGVLYQYRPDAAEELKKLDAKAAEIRERKPQEQFVRALVEPAGHQPESHLFYRGDFRQPKQLVSPAPLAVLSPDDQFVSFAADDPALPTTGRRLAFARWLTGPQNPITARVIVNRVWMHHFGKGLVETPADFGRMGAQPTHPALLDWLAKNFIDTGWDLKQLHRTIMLSTAYRQSTVRDPKMQTLDDVNKFYWRKNIVRLEAEILRDRVLSVTGQLDLALHGAPVPVKDDADGQAIVDSGAMERRSLYIQQRRTQPVSMLQAFDAPVMSVNCERRPSSTVATQSLMLMNSQFALNQAVALARKVIQEDKKEAGSESLVNGLPEISPPPPPQWSFGYGRVEENRSQFTPLPHFTSGKWQGGAMTPDPKLGWVILHATGGHTGTNPEFAAIRRWTAPLSGQVRVLSGTFSHGSPNGDGVRGRIISQKHGLLGEWTVHNQKVETKTEPVSIAAGETIDFVTDCRDNENSDSFQWEVILELTLPDGERIQMASNKGFHGEVPETQNLNAHQLVQVWNRAYHRDPTPEELELAISFLNQQFTELAIHPRELPEGVSASQQVLANLCQALLTSNEFLYVE